MRTLEERRGVRLIERSTRRMHMTQVGQLVLDAAKDVLTSVRSLEQVVEGHREAPTGTLRVTLPLDPSLSAMVAPIAAALTRQHAALKIDLVFDDAAPRLPGLERAEADPPRTAANAQSATAEPRVPGDAGGCREEPWLRPCLTAGELSDRACSRDSRRPCGVLLSYTNKPGKGPEPVSSVP